MSMFLVEKYCQLVEQEGGLTLLEEVVNSNMEGAEEVPNDYPEVQQLASTVIENVRAWKTEDKKTANEMDLNADNLEYDG